MTLFHDIEVDILAIREKEDYCPDYYPYNNQIGAPCMHAKEYLSATDLSKKTAATLEALEKGEAGKLIIMKNNVPKAVLLSAETYEAMLEELEDLRLAALAMARLNTFDRSTALSHREMLEKFGR